MTRASNDVPDYSPAALRALWRRQTTTDVPTAGGFAGMGVNKSYEMHKAGQFPFPVLQLGKKLRVPISAIAEKLGIDLDAGDAS